MELRSSLLAQSSSGSGQVHPVNWVDAHGKSGNYPFRTSPTLAMPIGNSIKTRCFDGDEGFDCRSVCCIRLLRFECADACVADTQIPIWPGAAPDPQPVKDAAIIQRHFAGEISCCGLKRLAAECACGEGLPASGDL
jgi:hypothetical protein